MHFCKECHNMYYIRLADKDKNKLIYYCRKCGDEEEIITEDNICVSKTESHSKGSISKNGLLEFVPLPFIKTFL